MTVKKQNWELSKRGMKDAVRHREKVRESIQKNIADIIGDSSIITRKGEQIIKVPIRGLKSYRFIYKQPGEGGSRLGQGKGNKGDIIDRQPIPGDQPGKAGDQPGVDYLETEIDIEELIEMMLKDLALPNLQKKETVETAIPKGWKYDSIEKTGIIPHLDRKRSIKEAIKRTAFFIGELMRITDRSEEECSKALSETDGNLNLALEILKLNKFIECEQPIIRIHNEDLRFRTLDTDIEYQSNAVVFAMMDISGSMTIIKKYLARSFFFWMVQFLKQVYSHVQIRFIAHTTEAKLVDEYEFFHKGESGGTYCYSAYDLANELIETEYPTSRFNIYCWHFSDGEDFDLNRTVSSAKKLIKKKINMLGYGEIHADEYWSGGSNLMQAFFDGLKLTKVDNEDIEVFSDFGNFVGIFLEDKGDVYPALKEFLKKDMDKK